MLTSYCMFAMRCDVLEEISFFILSRLGYILKGGCSPIRFGMVHCFVCFRSISRSDMPGRFQHACVGRQTASRLRAEAEGVAPAASAKARGLSPGRKRRSAPSADGRESASDGFGAGLEGKSSVLRSARSDQAHAVESEQCVGGADLTSGPQLGRGRKAWYRQCRPHSDRGV